MRPRSARGVVVDPFARDSHYGTITNDLNESFDTDYHMDALDFLAMLPDSCADLVLYDPPYSPRQASECYQKVGMGRLASNVTNSGYWSRCKYEVSRITKPLGRVVSCGWNTNGIGITRGFEIQYIHIVCHGGGHNDTLVVVEQKLGQLKLFGVDA